MTIIIWHIGSVHGQPLPVTELVVEMAQYTNARIEDERIWLMTKLL